MKVNKQRFAIASAIAITMASLTSLQAEDNPFKFKPVSNANDMTTLAMGMCGGMMEGMCGGNMPHGISPSMLPKPESAGAKALSENCTQCHGLPAPGMHTAEEWPSIVGRMNMRMQMMDGMMGIDAPDQQELNTVIDYLQTHAQQPINTADYPDLDSDNGKVFTQTCIQCHVLPEPKQHTAEEWPNVVNRMLGHIAVRNKPMPRDDEIEQIITYLERHSDKS
jgi:cytochrome c2